MVHKVATILAFFVLASDAASACDYRLNITTVSKHFGLPENHIEVNENNYGAGIACREGSHEYSIGYFKNSFFKDSFYVSRHDYVSTKYADIGLVYGAVTGYPENYRGVSPLLYGSLRKEIADIEIGLVSTLGYFIEDHVDAVVLTLGVPLE